MKTEKNTYEQDEYLHATKRNFLVGMKSVKRKCIIRNAIMNSNLIGRINENTAAA